MAGCQQETGRTHEPKKPSKTASLLHRTSSCPSGCHAGAAHIHALCKGGDMKIRTVAAVAVAALLLTACSGGSDNNTSSVASSHTLDSTDYAYMLCRAVDSTNTSTEPCKVDTPNIDIHAAIDSGTAQVACAAIAKAAREKGWVFESYWRVRYFSPYASGGPIATCSL